MTQSGLARYAPLSGLVFAVLLIAAIIVGSGADMPDVEDSPQAIAAAFEEDDSTLAVASFLSSFSMVFLIWFGGSVRAALRGTNADSDRLAALAFGGFLLIAVGWIGLAGFTFAAADTAGEVAPEVTQTLLVLTEDLFMPFQAGVIVAMLAIGIAILRHGALPRALGHVALAAGILAFTPAWFIGIPLAGIWVIVASVLLYRGAGAPAPPPAASMPA